MTGVKLVFQLDKTLIGSDKTPRQNPRDVKYRDWVFPKKLCISDIKLRIFQRSNVRCMRSI